MKNGAKTSVAFIILVIVNEKILYYSYNDLLLYVI